eukprot:3199792-Amphidinium_carterae.1
MFSTTVSSVLFIGMSSLEVHASRGLHIQSRSVCMSGGATSILQHLPLNGPRGLARACLVQTSMLIFLPSRHTSDKMRRLCAPILQHALA